MVQLPVPGLTGPPPGYAHDRPATHCAADAKSAVNTADTADSSLAGTGHRAQGTVTGGADGGPEQRPASHPAHTETGCGPTARAAPPDARQRPCAPEQESRPASELPPHRERTWSRDDGPTRQGLPRPRRPMRGRTRCIPGARTGRAPGCWPPRRRVRPCPGHAPRSCARRRGPAASPGRMTGGRGARPAATAFRRPRTPGSRRRRSPPEGPRGCTRPGSPPHPPQRAPAHAPPGAGGVPNRPTRRPAGPQPEARAP